MRVGIRGGGCQTGLGRPVGPAAEERRLLQRGAGLLRVLSRPPTGGHLPFRDNGGGTTELVKLRQWMRPKCDGVGDGVEPCPDQILVLGECAER